MATTGKPGLGHLACHVIPMGRSGGLKSPNHPVDTAKARSGRRRDDDAPLDHHGGYLCPDVSLFGLPPSPADSGMS